MKECTVCRNELTITQRKYCSNKCKSKGHYDNIKNQTNSYHSQYIRSLKRKIKLIEMKGGCCQECGYMKNLASLDFHHRDGRDKESKLDMRVLANRKWEFVLNEAEKCDLLCSNCHREEHHPSMNFERILDLINEHKNHKIDRNRNQTNCVDCKSEINYNSTRCTTCEKKRRSKNKPDLEVLREEKKTNSYAKLAEKYSVGKTSIRRWLNEM